MFPAAGVGVSVSAHWALPFIAPFLPNILYDGTIPALMVGSMNIPHPPPEEPLDFPRPDVIKLGVPTVLLNGVIFCPIQFSTAWHVGGAPTFVATGIPTILIGA